jgi:hypothetical protein
MYAATWSIPAPSVKAKLVRITPARSFLLLLLLLRTPSLVLCLVVDTLLCSAEMADAQQLRLRPGKSSRGKSPPADSALDEPIAKKPPKVPHSPLSQLPLPWPAPVIAVWFGCLCTA